MPPLPRAQTSTYSQTPLQLSAAGGLCPFSRSFYRSDLCRAREVTNGEQREPDALLFLLRSRSRSRPLSFLPLAHAFAAG